MTIFGCPVYIHVPWEKRTKLDPAGKQGIFVGYSELAKAYRIYIPDQRKMKLSRDVTFQEDVAYQRSRRTDSDSDDSQELLASPSPPVEKETVEDEIIDPTYPVHPVILDHVPRDTIVLEQKRRPTWARQTLQDAEGHAAPCPFRKSNRPQRYGCYVALMSSLLDSEPSRCEEAYKHQCWRDAMTEEYESILKNDVWDIVPRPEEKSVVTSKWIFKIKHVADRSIEKYKARFVARRFSQREGGDYDETFAPVARFTSIRTIIALASAMRWRYLRGTIGYGLRYSADSDIQLIGYTDRIGQK